MQYNLSIFNDPGPNYESLLVNDEKEDDSIEDENADPAPNDDSLLVNDEKEDHSIEDENLIFENNQSIFDSSASNNDSPSLVNDEKEDGSNKSLASGSNTCRHDSQSCETIIIPASFWKKYWNGTIRLNKGWTNSFNDLLKKHDKLKLCVFSFRDNKCYSKKKKNNKFFIANATCKNRLCTKIDFISYTPITELFVDITIHAEPEGAIDHDPNDIHRQNCRGAERVKVAAAV
ncbi:hypothetical protein KQX54_015060 [Cotesia glomerata]|uniref:Uncharacterized protein n=1 Tax=Cotesia glomerata TaxID=32391 RepID=A0AAV7I7G6_COTGL|nr:hypothetical protein KQX54_015060 [Cotesia glomerata]